MASVTRRHFVRETACAAALYGWSPRVVGHARALFDAGEQSAALDAETIRKLASRVIGQVIVPGGRDYEAARSIFNRAFDRHPAVIVHCAEPSDVARALDFAGNKNLPLAVRGGGHSRLGYGM